MPDEYFPEAGQPSAGIRIVDVRLSGRKLIIVADVPTGRSSYLDLQSEWKLISHGEQLVKVDRSRTLSADLPARVQSFRELSPNKSRNRNQAVNTISILEVISQSTLNQLCNF